MNKVLAELQDEKSHSPRYQFTSLVLDSAHSNARYQVRVGIPNRSRPSKSYAVLYMLDGEAALAALKEQNFSGLVGDDWPVIVTLGHKGVPRSRQVQAVRTYDYTPGVLDSSGSLSGGTGSLKNSLSDNSAAPQYGGAEAFWQFIEQEVKPQVSQRVTLDPTRQSLWGHSFGGLFVLHTLFNHPESFQNYIVADGSLWWQQGQILQAEARYREKYGALSARPQGQLLIQRSASQRTGSVLPEDASRQLAKRLSQLPELRVQYYEYFHHHHGSIRAASIPPALRMAQGIEQQ